MENTCPFSHVFTFDCQTPDQTDERLSEGEGQQQRWSHQSIFVKDFSGETPDQQPQRSSQLLAAKTAVAALARDRFGDA